jgi:flagellar export protein FliJ
VKKFAFQLGRVMDFRRMQARLEEAKLENLYAGLRAIDAREVMLIRQRAESEKALKSARSVTGFELELFSRYGVAMKEEQKRMDKTRAECRKRIDQQLAVLMVKRREVKLLETLKEQKFETWEKEMFKEIDQQAEEAYLAKWNAREQALQAASRTDSSTRLFRARNACSIWSSREA